MRKQIITMILLFFATVAFAQDMKVSGVVTSAEDGEPMIGVTVRVKENPSNGVSTDFDGQYTITIQAGQTLAFSYVGCQTYEHKVTAPGTLDVVLEPETNMLQEVVAIGYGTMKKSDLTGSVSSVSADKLKKTPAASLANALQGQAAGVTVNSLTGRPGAQAEVRIRGVGTVNGASPIYVVDGVITDDISFLSPNDIERTEILKDASATAIYGSRGANGVIIVTTRGGQRNRDAQITFNAYVGWQSRIKKLDVMNAKDYADTYVNIVGDKGEKKFYAENGLNAWLNEYNGVNNDFFPTVYNPDTNPTGFNYEAVDTDWQDAVFRTGMIQNYHLSIDGGGDKFTYSMSGSWFKQEGTIIGSDYSRFTGRLNTSYQATPWLKIGENLSFMAGVAKNTFSDGDNTISEGANILSAAFAMAPWDPTRYPEGSVNPSGKDISNGISAASNFKNVTNPLSMVEYSHPKNRSERWVGNVFAEINPIEHLTFRSSFAFDYRWNFDKLFKDAYEVSSYDQSKKNFISSSMARYYNWTVDNILTYARTIGKHDFSVMAGQSTEEYNFNSLGGSGASILNPIEKNWYLSQATEDFSKPGEGVSRNRRFSWLGRLHYSFNNRYLATFNFRADGSSKFRDNAWGYFPSFALAWRMSQESWLRDFTPLSDLKLRFGWGKVGNDQIGNDAFVLNMFNSGPTFVDYVFGSTPALANGATVLTWVNKGGHWENTEQWSVGVDFAWFNNKLTGSIDGFIRNTNDMLMSVNAPAHVGNRYSATANVGKVRNRGIELQLEHRNTVTKDFHYSIGGNISFIDNELTALNGGSPIYTNFDQVQVVDQGHPLYYFWGYEYMGIFQSEEQIKEYLPNSTEFRVGDAIYRDVNGDGKIDNSDRVDLGSSIPKINYGINLGAWYRDFDLQIFFQGVAGNKIYNQMRMRLEGDDFHTVFAPEMANAWTVDNPTGNIPNPKSTVNYYTSDRFLESGNYFRLKDLQIGYSLPKSLLSKAGFENCRIYLQGSNLLTATKYKGFDPEVNGGVDYGNYPQSRTYLIGVSITY